MTLAEFLFLVCWSLWLGSVVFFSWILLPAIHSELKTEQAAPLLHVVFRRYYIFGIALGTICMIVSLSTRPDPRIWVPLGIATLLTGYSLQVVTAELSRARRDNDDEAFGRAHITSVRINLVVLAALFLVGTIL